MYVTTSNKRQFYTVNQSDQNSGNQAVNKHKFSNLTGYGSGINTNMNNPNPNLGFNVNSNQNYPNSYVNTKNNASLGADTNLNINADNRDRPQNGYIIKSVQNPNPKISTLIAQNKPNQDIIGGRRNFSPPNPSPSPKSNNTSVYAYTNNKQSLSNEKFSIRHDTESERKIGKLSNQKSSSPFNHSRSNQIQTIKIQQKCIICQLPTQKCCSLCRKVFYCSPEHQEVDWHTRHKFICEGKASIEKQREKTAFIPGQLQQPINPGSMNNKFIFYSNNPLKNHANQQYQQQLATQSIQKFLQLLEQRLVMRVKIMNQVSKLTERTPLIVRQSLVKQTQQLLQLSLKITNQEFKPSFSRRITKKDIMEYSHSHWGSEVVISEIGVGLELYADMVLMGKIYHLSSMSKQARQIIINIGKSLEDIEQIKLFLSSQQFQIHNGQPKNDKKLSIASANLGNSHSTQNPSLTYGYQSHSPSQKPSQQVQPTTEDQLSKTKNLILQSIIQLSQLYHIDKATQSAYKIFVKRVEGIWEQIYAYFNIGVWYMRKTYYFKSSNCFLYVLQMLQIHKKNTTESVIFKGDCLFNLAQVYWALGDRNKAIQNMQQSYRNRINGIGKNSMQCSYCLYKLAKWYRQLQKWTQCLQYLDQCHRIRKQYQNQLTQPYEKKLEEIKILISEVYDLIKQQKIRNMSQLQPKAEKYYEQLLTKERQEQQRLLQKKDYEDEVLPRGTVTSRLFKSDKQYIKFKIILSEEFWSTVTSQQAGFLAQLVQLTDQKFEKLEAIRVMTQSKFVTSLNNQQRQRFFKQNQIEKIKL